MIGFILIDKLLKSIFILFLGIFFLLSTTFSIDYTPEYKDINKEITRVTNLINFHNERESKLDKIEKIALSYKNDFVKDNHKELSELIYNMSIKYENLTPEFICSVISQESAWNVQAVSPVGARGLLQLMPYTASFLSVEEGIELINYDMIFDWKLNLRLGCRYLNWGMSEYGSKEAALVEYNSGAHWANHYIRTGEIIPTETQQYVPKILNREREYYEL